MDSVFFTGYAAFYIVYIHFLLIISPNFTASVADNTDSSCFVRISFEQTE